MAALRAEDGAAQTPADDRAGENRREDPLLADLHLLHFLSLLACKRPDRRFSKEPRRGVLERPTEPLRVRCERRRPVVAAAESQQRTGNGNPPPARKGLEPRGKIASP